MRWRLNSSIIRKRRHKDPRRVRAPSVGLVIVVPHSHAWRGSEWELNYYNFIIRLRSFARFAQTISHGYCSAAQRPLACYDRCRYHHEYSLYIFTHARSTDRSAPWNNTYCITHCPTYKMSLRSFRMEAQTLWNRQPWRLTSTTLLSVVFQIEHILDVIYWSSVRNRSYRSRTSEPQPRTIPCVLILSRVAETLDSTTQRRSFDGLHKHSAWTVDAVFIVLTLLNSTYLVQACYTCFTTPKNYFALDKISCISSLTLISRCWSRSDLFTLDTIIRSRFTSWTGNAMWALVRIKERSHTGKLI